MVAISLAVSIGRASAAGVSPDVDSAAARVLFEEGLRHLDAKRWDVAADRFARANALRSSPEVVYNLATAHARGGRPVVASELLRRLEADETAKPEVRTAAAARLEQVLPQIARLTIEVPSTRAVHVHLDGTALRREALGVALPVDPGRRVVEARRAALVLDRREVQLAAGGRAVVRLSWDAAPPAASRAIEAETEARATPAPAVYERWWFWGAIGAVAAGAVAAAVIASTGSDVRGNVDTWRVGGP